MRREKREPRPGIAAGRTNCTSRPCARGKRTSAWERGGVKRLREPPLRREFEALRPSAWPPDAAGPPPRPASRWRSAPPGEVGRAEGHRQVGGGLVDQPRALCEGDPVAPEEEDEHVVQLHPGQRQRGRCQGRAQAVGAGRAAPERERRGEDPADRRHVHQVGAEVCLLHLEPGADLRGRPRARPQRARRRGEAAQQERAALRPGGVPGVPQVGHGQHVDAAGRDDRPPEHREGHVHEPVAAQDDPRAAHDQAPRTPERPPHVPPARVTHEQEGEAKADHHRVPRREAVGARRHVRHGQVALRQNPGRPGHPAGVLDGMHEAGAVDQRGQHVGHGRGLQVLGHVHEGEEQQGLELALQDPMQHKRQGDKQRQVVAHPHLDPDLEVAAGDPPARPLAAGFARHGPQELQADVVAGAHAGNDATEEAAGVAARKDVVLAAGWGLGDREHAQGAVHERVRTDPLDGRARQDNLALQAWVLLAEQRDPAPQDRQGALAVVQGERAVVERRAGEGGPGATPIEETVVDEGLCELGVPDPAVEADVRGAVCRAVRTPRARAQGRGSEGRLHDLALPAVAEGAVLHARLGVLEDPLGVRVALVALAARAEESVAGGGHQPRAELDPAEGLAQPGRCLQGLAVEERPEAAAGDHQPLRVCERGQRVLVEDVEAAGRRRPEDNSLA
mmetsp:Transcript_102396/g.320160  ORF Transcript_102396/g.320160 Transcript_102396/m.320160 type:complete len:677 (-) Transcript_102396:706-2736(-)